MTVRLSSLKFIGKCSLEKRSTRFLLMMPEEPARSVVIGLVRPVVGILRKVHFLSCPEGHLGLLVHLPDLCHVSVKGSSK